MNEKELNEYLKQMDVYIEKIKNGTREEAISFLIKAGILEEDGELSENYGGKPRKKKGE